MKTPLLILLLLLPGTRARAQGVDSLYLLQIERMIDSLERQKQLVDAVQAYEGKLLQRETQLRYDMFLPMARGLFTTATNHSFIERTPLLTEHSTGALDYIPALSPLCATYTLRALGIEGRSSTRRLVTATAFAAALEISLTQGLKYSVHERRPDGSSNHSMPSGHTAVAYLSATILHREYGHLSPWISVGGYSTATLTEYLRLRHHDHYINDILLGSGIGIAAANLGYFLSDQLFGTGDIHPPRLLLADVQRYQRFAEQPTSLCLFTSTEFGGRTIEPAELDLLDAHFDGELRLRTASTYAAGIEYAYFFDNHWAAEAVARLSATQVKPDIGATTTYQEADYYGADLQQWHLLLAGKYSRMITPSARLHVRLLAGSRLTEKLTIRHATTGTPLATLPAQTRFEAGAGIGIDVLEKEKYATGFTFDYLRAANTDLLPNRYSFSTYWRILL